MIVCRKCSRRHADGTEFCVCGAFLEFDGEHVADPPGAPAPEQARPAGRALTEQPQGPPVGSPSAEPAPWSGFSSDVGTRPAPSGSIDARPPDAPIQPPSTEPVWIEPTARIGDVPCRHCGAPNPPERQFCRHCGQDLSASTSKTTGAARTDRLRWWQRLGRSARRRGRRTNPTTMAMQAQQIARGGVSWRSTLFRMSGVMIVIAGLLAFLGPWRPTVIARGKDALGVSRYRDIDVTAEEVETAPSDERIPLVPIPLQGEDKVVDRFSNTAWATRWLNLNTPGFEEAPTEEGCQPAGMTDSYLHFEFAESTDLARIRILPGRLDGDPARELFSRPRVLELRVDDGPCSFIVLEDKGELTAHDFDHDNASTVEIRVIGIYAPEVPIETVEISEIVFDR